MTLVLLKCSAVFWGSNDNNKNLVLEQPEPEVLLMTSETSESGILPHFFYMDNIQVTCIEGITRAKLKVAFKDKVTTNMWKEEKQ